MEVIWIRISANDWKQFDLQKIEGIFTGLQILFPHIQFILHMKHGYWEIELAWNLIEREMKE